MVLVDCQNTIRSFCSEYAPSSEDCSQEDEDSDDGCADLPGLSEDEAGDFDDADDEYYEQRLARSWLSMRRGRKATAAAGRAETAAEAVPGSAGRQCTAETADAEEEEDEETAGPEASVSFDGGFRVPERVYR